MRIARAQSPEKEGHGSDQRIQLAHAPDDSGGHESGGAASVDSLRSLKQQMSQESEEASEESEKLASIVEADPKRGAARKQHWKSQSVGESGSSSSVQSSATQEDDFQEHTTFSANRELWQRRATSQTQLNPPNTPSGKLFRASQEFREMRQKHTPDLVMDLPLSAQDPSKKSASTSSLSSSSDEESPGGLRPRNDGNLAAVGPESPDMSTAAERFAKQNQCTLKKNTKSSVDNGKPKQEHESEGDNDPGEIVRSASSNQISDTLPLKSPVPSRSTPKIAAKFADMHLTGGSQMQVSSFKPQVKVKPTILRKPVLPYPHPHMSPELARKIEKQAQSTEQAN